MQTITAPTAAAAAAPRSAIRGRVRSRFYPHAPDDRGDGGAALRCRWTDAVHRVRAAVFGAVWLSPLLLGMAHDWITRRRIHLAYIVATLALFIGGTRILVTQSELWLRIGRPVFDAIL